jgi:hypothetical protein
MTRDMTRKEFRAALTRRGWRQELLWITGTDKAGHTCGIGQVMRRKGSRGWVTDRRAWLAKAIRELKEGET